jgi:hypothetical protein
MGGRERFALAALAYAIPRLAESITILADDDASTAFGTACCSLKQPKRAVLKSGCFIGRLRGLLHDAGRQ